MSPTEIRNHSQQAPIGIGQKLGKYVVQDKIGEGGMGVVFGGMHEALGRQVAIKLLRGEFAKNDMITTRFIHEAEAVSRIGHSNIVAVYDFGRLDDGSVYYVMERIKGETLTARMQRQPPLSAQEIVGIFSQICRALHATHTRGIVHRDLKPDNILLVPQDSGVPHVKVLDFGVAKMRDPGAEAGAATGGDPGGGANLTKVGTLLGTPTYMAPEQITSSATVDGRADLYSLGAILYEVLTGMPPFGRGELMMILTAHVKQQVLPPSQKVPESKIPQALDTMVVKSLAKKPAERQADANAFITELEAAFGLGSAPSVKRGDSTETVKPIAGGVAGGGRKKLIAAAAGAVLLLGGGGVTFALLKGKGAEKEHHVAAAPAQTPLQIVAGKVIAVALGGDAQQRRAAVEALGEVGDRAAIDQIITALGDDNPEVRRAAANAAIAIGHSDDAALRAALTEAAGRSGGAVAVDLAAARYKAGDEAAEGDLKKALETRDPAIRLRAAVALAERGKLPAQLLRSAIAAAPPTVRRSLRWAAYARLQQLGDPAFAAELKTAVAGTDPVAKLDAAQTLARARDQAGLVALSHLANEAPDPIDRVDAAAVQAELGDVGALDALAGALTDPKPAVRARAATSLGRLAPQLKDHGTLEKQLSPLLKDSDAPPRIAAAAALLAIRPGHPTPTPTTTRTP